MARIARMIGVGYPHHIVQRGNNKQTVFFDNKDRKLYLNLLRKYSVECNCSLHAYCLMNNHVHLLLTPRLENSLAKTMQKLSLTFTQHVNKKYERSGRLWECRFHSAIVDRDSYLWAVCRYIERNPIRARMVDNPEQYEWSSATLDVREQGNCFIESIWESDQQREAYRAFLNMQENEEESEKMEKATFSGRPIAKEGFLEQLSGELGINIKSRPVGRPSKLSFN